MYGYGRKNSLGPNLGPSVLGHSTVLSLTQMTKVDSVLSVPVYQKSGSHFGPYEKSSYGKQTLKKTGKSKVQNNYRTKYFKIYYGKQLS